MPGSRRIFASIIRGPTINLHASVALDALPVSLAGLHSGLKTSSGDWWGNIKTCNHVPISGITKPLPEMEGLLLYIFAVLLSGLGSLAGLAPEENTIP